jgi:predicted dehydrogenase
MERFTMTDKPVRFAIVGLGMGRVRAKDCMQTPGAELALLCDTDPQRLARSTAEFQVPGTPSFDEVLKRDDVEAVLIETWYRDDPYYEGWHGTWKMDGGGSLMNQTVHLIDQLQWYGGAVEQVVGRMKVYTHKIETEDLGLALVDFKNGAKGVIVGTTTFPESRTYDMEIHGSKFAAAWGSVNGQYCKSLPAGTELPPRPAEAPRNIFEDVIGALRHGRKVMVDGREGRKSVELILAVYKSAVTGKPVKLPLKSFTPPVSTTAGR